MSINIKSFTIGLPTRENEDSHAITNISDKTSIAIIADGVGGNIAGKLASQTAVNLATELLSKNPNADFNEVVRQITDEFKKITSSQIELSDMATTLTICVVDDHSVKYAHVGDSRLYHLRSNGIVQKTNDQTEVALLVQQGVLTPRRAKDYPRKSYLLSAISSRAEYDLLIGSFELEDNDRLVLATDGAYAKLSKIELRDLSVTSLNLENFSMNISNLLNERSLSDDATVIVIEYHQTPTKSSQLVV